ncbi:transcription elongation factor TFIIS [Coemansia sp. RSA 2559]|nr:transcription elongation factor TFIIS [Coemansia sp. RSA 2559]
MAILDIQFRGMECAPNVDMNELVSKTDGFSGAEVVSLCQEAGMKAMSDDPDATCVEMCHFLGCLAEFKSRVSPEALEYDRRMKLEAERCKTIISATGAGQVVGRLRNYDNADIAVMAKKVVHKWKKDVVAANSRASSASDSGTKADSRSQTPQQVVGQGLSGTQQHNGDENPCCIPTLRTAESDKATIPQTGDGVRDKCIELLYNSMALDSNADSRDIVERAEGIELVEFNKAGSVSTAYRARIRSLCLNLKDKKNPDLRKNIVEGNISVDRFCSMTSEEMASKELREAIERIKEENLFKAKGATRVEAETSQFKCSRCGERRCSFYQMQTRSADEPMTTFVTSKE